MPSLPTTGFHLRALLRNAEINPRHLLFEFVKLITFILVLVVRQVLPLDKAIIGVASAALAFVSPELLVGTVPKDKATPITILEDQSAILMCGFLGVFLFLYVNYPPPFSGL